MSESLKARPIVIVNFDNYNPPHKAVNEAIRKGGPLTWLRWETTGHRDPAILDMPLEDRWLWIVLLGLAGKQQRTPDGLRIIRMTTKQLAREAEMPPENVERALTHLWKTRRIRFSTGGARVAAGWPRTNVPTYLHTDVPGTGSNEPSGTSAEVARLIRLYHETSTPSTKASLLKKIQRLGGEVATA